MRRTLTAFLACLFVVTWPLVGAAGAAGATAAVDGVERPTATAPPGPGHAGTAAAGAHTGADVARALSAATVERRPNATDAGTLQDEDDVPYTCSDSQRNYATVSEEGPYSFEDANETVFEIPSEQDGEAIQIGLVRPTDPETGQPVADTPVIVRATPYVDDLRNDDVKECWGVKRLADNYVQHGYAVAVVPVRGTGGAGGCMDLFGPAERRDLDQAITYLGEAGWSNGNVAMTGGSYDGTTPFEVAGMGNPHLKTIFPMAGVPNVHELMYRNGAPETRGPLILNALYYGISFGTDSPVTGTKPETYATRAECPDEYAQGEFASAYSGATGEKDPGGYWAARNLRPLVERNYEGSIFIVQGFQDWNVDPSQIYPWAEELEADEDIEVRYMLGQWGHAYPDDGDWAEGTRRNDWADIMLAWLDHELKGEDVAVGPDAYVQDSTGQWRAEETWPPERAETETWYLRPDDTLSRTASDDTGTRTVAVDPDRHQSLFYPGEVPGCDTCARFETARFEEDYRFAGEPDLNLTVTPSGPGGYLSAHVLAVDGNGTERRVGWGMVDLRYADRGRTADTVVPGQPLDVSVPIEPLDARIPEGSKLVVVLHQGTMQQRIGGTPPYPLEVQVGNGSATFEVQQFEATADPVAAPDPVDDGGPAVPAVEVARSDDGSLFTGGQTNHVQVTVNASRGVQVRDTVPAEWSVTGSDVRAVDDNVSGDVKHVYLGTAPASGETTFDYFAEAPDEPTASGSYTFGPVAVRAGGNWTAVDGTTDTNYVVGVDQNAGG